MENKEKEISSKDLDSVSKSKEPDYYINDLGDVVFTAAYHLKRGYCCTNNCLHCPYAKK